MKHKTINTKVEDSMANRHELLAKYKTIKQVEAEQILNCDVVALVNEIFVNHSRKRFESSNIVIIPIYDFCRLVSPQYSQVEATFEQTRQLLLLDGYDEPLAALVSLNDLERLDELDRIDQDVLSNKISESLNTRSQEGLSYSDQYTDDRLVG